MTRTEILNVINKIIENEHGKQLTEEQLLIDCGIDSFGYAIFWCELESVYEVELAKNVMKQDYNELTVAKVIDMVVEAKNVSK